MELTVAIPSAHLENQLIWASISGTTFSTFEVSILQTIFYTFRVPWRNLFVTILAPTSGTNVLDIVSVHFRNYFQTSEVSLWEPFSYIFRCDDKTP